MSEPYTHEVEDRSERKNKFCTCSICGETSRCTRDNDFYHVGEHEVGKPLLCTRCFYTWVANRRSRS